MQIKLLIILLLCLTSCDVQRQVAKTNSRTDTQEQLEQITQRKGDTVTYKNVLHVKDTTIYTVNKQGTTLRTVYDSSGNVSQVDCFSSAISEILKYSKDMQQANSTKDKTESAKFDPTFIYVAGGGITIVLCFFIFLLYRTINQNTKLLQGLSQKLT